MAVLQIILENSNLRNGLYKIGWSASFLENVSTLFPALKVSDKELKLDKLSPAGPVMLVEA